MRAASVVMALYGAASATTLEDEMTGGGTTRSFTVVLEKPRASCSAARPRSTASGSSARASTSLLFDPLAAPGLAVSVKSESYTLTALR